MELSVIRVLHIIGSMDLGGAETMIMNIYREVNKDIIQFDFFISSPNKCYYEDEIYLLGGNVYRSLKKSKYPVQYWINLHRLIKRNQYNVIHIHASSAKDFYPAMIAFFSKVSIRIVHSHSSDGINCIKQFFLSKLLNMFVSQRLACSDLAAKWMFGKKASKTLTINNPIDVRKFIFSDIDRKKIRDFLNIRYESVFIHVGNFYPVKNHHFLIKIFKEIVNISPNSILLLIGQGPEQDYIKTKILEENLSNHVIILGQKDNIHSFLSASDVFIMPSLFEGFPIAAIEAQANGVSLVLSNTITSQVKQTDLVTFLSLDESPRIWAKNALNMIGKSRNSRKKYNEKLIYNFDAKNIVNQLLKVYQNKGKIE